MIIVIRIAGLVEIPNNIQQSLDMIRLRRKYSAILLKETPENKGLLQQIRNHVAYGKIDKDTLKELINKRGVALPSKKINMETIADEVEKNGLEASGLKPFFRLHPPRGGISTKKHYPIKDGVLGDNKEHINELVRRML